MFQLRKLKRRSSGGGKQGMLKISSMSLKKTIGKKGTSKTRKTATTAAFFNLRVVNIGLSHSVQIPCDTHDTSVV